eukprot:Skav206838  [mRNA]  locus=scaffold637:174773:180923:- [translate_table: standard]
MPSMPSFYLSCLLKIEDVQAFHPNGIILSGGPHSVYDKDAPHLSNQIWHYIDEKRLPVFGICYGLQDTALKPWGRRSTVDLRSSGPWGISPRRRL